MHSLSSLSYHQRITVLWLLVAITSCIAILCFLAALYHKLDLEHIGTSSSIRRRNRHGRRQLFRYHHTRHLLQTETRFNAIRWLEYQQQPNATRQQQSIIKCNGHINLCDRYVNEITFATLHNAMSSVAKTGAVIVKNHIQSFEDALVAGYRGLNFDIGLCNGKVQLVHTSCLLATRDLKDAIQSIVNFLIDNPNEVLLLPTQLLDTVTLQEIESVFQSVPTFYNMLYNHNPTNTKWPTLRELIQWNQRILFFHYNGPSCTKVENNTTGVLNSCPYGFHPWFLYAAETEYNFLTVKELENYNRSCRITRGGSGRNNFFGINLFVTPSRFLTTYKRIHQSNFIARHVQTCVSQNNKTLVNALLVNYWDVGDVLQVVNDMNAALV